MGNINFVIFERCYVFSELLTVGVADLTGLTDLTGKVNFVTLRPSTCALDKELFLSRGVTNVSRLG